MHHPTDRIEHTMDFVTPAVEHWLELEIDPTNPQHHERMVLLGSYNCNCSTVITALVVYKPLLLIGKSSLCGGSGFPLSLSEWSLTICLTPYNRK